MFRYFTLMCLMVFFIGATNVLAEEIAKTYLAHNIWYENPKKVEAIGFKRGTRIPCGTEVSNVVLNGNRGVSFTVPQWSLHLTLFIDKHQKDLLTVDELKNRLFTSIPLEERMKKFSEQEKNCVKNGNIAIGISKEAVLMAYGYPPKHRTPSTEMPSWVYWTSRFITRSVDFSEEGKTLNAIGD